MTVPLHDGTVPPDPDEPLRPLTSRQLDIARLIESGQSYADIAGHLAIARRTVEFHVEQIMNVLPNPDGLDPYLCIFLYMRHRTWLARVAQKSETPA